jgi:hypothetical protein
MATLAKSDTRPPDLTLYVKIPIGAAGSDLTGIFFSRNFNSEMPLSVILYLRGWTENALAIDKFWSDAMQPQRLLREKVNSSRKNLILVAPTLGPHSEAGTLLKSGGAEAYLDQVIDSLRFKKRKTVTVRDGDHDLTFEDLGVEPGDDDGDDDAPPGPGQDLVDSLVLAAHSGGGTRMASVASNLGRYADKVVEVWGFDCTYVASDVTALLNFARAHASAKLHYHYIAYSPTQDVAVSLKKRAAEAGLRNMTVEITKRGIVHDWVPITYLEPRIRAAPALL